MTEAEAVRRARDWATGTAETAKVSVSVMTYREHLRRMGGYAVQLGLTDPVIHVVVEAPFVARFASARPRPPLTYRRYETGFDPRTGHRLGVGARDPIRPDACEPARTLTTAGASSIGWPRKHE